jgi:hypothetical protein
LYGLAGINGQNKNGGPKYMEYMSSQYWKRANWNDQERVNERFRSKNAVERGSYVRCLCVPFTPTVGKEAFLREPS